MSTVRLYVYHDDGYYDIVDLDDAKAMLTIHKDGTEEYDIHLSEADARKVSKAAAPLHAVTIELDGRKLAEAVMQHMPSVIRLSAAHAHAYQNRQWVRGSNETAADGSPFPIVTSQAPNNVGPDAIWMQVDK